LDKRRKAIEELKKMMRQRRADIDPAVLLKARAAAERRDMITAAERRDVTTSAERKNAKGEKDPSMVPYDRDAARKAVALFLQLHPDQKRFSRDLADFMNRNTH